METQNLPKTEAFENWVVPIKESLASLEHQFSNFSVPSQNKSFIVTGDVNVYLKHLKALTAFLNRVHTDIVTDKVCIIQFSPDEQSTKPPKRKVATRRERKVVQSGL